MRDYEGNNWEKTARELVDRNYSRKKSLKDLFKFALNKINEKREECLGIFFVALLAGGVIPSFLNTIEDLKTLSYVNKIHPALIDKSGYVLERNDGVYCFDKSQSTETSKLYKLCEEEDSQINRGENVFPHRMDGIIVEF